MDSLFATYASSDEEDDQQKPQPSSNPSLSLFSSLPKPQSSSLSVPKSSSQIDKQSLNQESSTLPPKSSALFSFLPPPKSEATPNFSLPTPNNPKRVVQFRPPVPTPPSNLDDDDDEEDGEDEEERERKKQRQLGQDVSVKSFLSSMPTPKNSGHNSLGATPSSLGSGRRSIVETDGPTSVPGSSEVNGVNSEVGFESNVENNQQNLVGESNSYNYEVGNYEVGVAGDQVQGYANYDAYGSSSSDYGSGYQGYDGSNWYNGASAAEIASTLPVGGFDGFASLGGRRRKDQPPAEIIELKQDELMKNRPTEDKSKLTGIAFGPSYQPASTKGKPSKQHKRKHQISALYFDMKQKEMELSERRAKGFLTKAETQAKYGW